MAFCSPRKCTFLSHSSVWCHVVAEPAWAQKSLVQTYSLMPSWHQTHILCLIFLTVFVIHWWGMMKTTFGAWGNEVKTIFKKMYGPTTYRPGDHHDRGQEYARLGFMWCLFPWHMFCMVWYFFLCSWKRIWHILVLIVLKSVDFKGGEPPLEDRASNQHVDWDWAFCSLDTWITWITIL